MSQVSLGLEAGVETKISTLVFKQRQHSYMNAVGSFSTCRRNILLVCAKGSIKKHQ